VAPSEALDPAEVKEDSERLLQAIREARSGLEDLPGVLDGQLDRFRERIDRMIRESEVDNWRQVRIFLRDVDAIAADLAKAAKDRALHPKHLHLLDLSLRKARNRDFYGARKAWRKLDKVAEQAAEVLRLQGEYRDVYRGAEARVRHLVATAERLSKIPRPPASSEDATGLIASVDAFNGAAAAAYMDFLARARAQVAIPLLLEFSQGSGVGVPAPPRGSDPDPLLALLSDAEPARDAIRSRSFFGLLELPGYSDAKLTHLYGDARLIRGSLDAAWPWLKKIRDEERRTLDIEWTDDVGVLSRRVPAIVTLLERIEAPDDVLSQGRTLVEDLRSGRFVTLQAAARMYRTYGADAERQWRGELEGAIRDMRTEADAIRRVLKALPDPGQAEPGVGH
jgi:hypothetical protein